MILGRIHVIRGFKVMLDADLAELYGVKTKVLKQAVRRNIERFPDDFMFELTKAEYDHLRSQTVTSGPGGTRYMPMAFSEHGVLMLSSVLRSAQAVQMNIQIMRVFVRIRRLLESHQELLLKLERIERTTQDQGAQIQLLYDHVRRLLTKQDGQSNRKRIGFRQDQDI